MTKRDAILQDILDSNRGLPYNYANDLSVLGQAYDAADARANKLLEVLNRIALLGSGEKAYTSDFTNEVNSIVRATLQEENK